MEGKHTFFTLVLLYTLVISSKALQCLDCSGDVCHSKLAAKCSTDGRCFIRKDPNGLIYRGCVNLGQFWGLDIDYNGCKKQRSGGWKVDGKFVMVEWCFCSDGDDCNDIDMVAARRGVYPVDLELVVKLNGTVEAPVFDSEGKLFVSDILFNPSDPVPFSGGLFKIDTNDKTVEPFAFPVVNGNVGAANGLALDKEGFLWLADAQLGLMRLTPSGGYTIVETHDTDGNVVKGMNDLVFDYDGTLWITAPYPEVPGVVLTPLTDLVDGSIYCYQPKTGTISHLGHGFHFPNGVAVQHDKKGQPKVLVVAEMYPKILWAWDIVAPCVITNKRVWGTVPSGYVGGPDGIDFDKNNNLLVTTYFGSAIYVFGPEGGLPFTRIDMPFEAVTNVECAQNQRPSTLQRHQKIQCGGLNGNTKERRRMAYCKLFLRPALFSPFANT